jgi:hypothetical protein
MTLQGYVHDGRIIFDPPAVLPEGAEVQVEVIVPRTKSEAANRPLSPFKPPVEIRGEPLSVTIIRDRR